MHFMSSGISKCVVQPMKVTKKTNEYVKYDDFGFDIFIFFFIYDSIRSYWRVSFLTSIDDKNNFGFYLK